MTAPPSPWVERFLAAAPDGGTVLDVACGSGRHIEAALALGLRVTAIDRDVSRADRFSSDPRVTLIAADLETAAPFPTGPHCFDAVIVTNYLSRPILPDIVAAVAPAGLLIYETFAVGNERFGRPSNPDYLLRPGELLDAVAGRLVPVAYEHLRLTDPDRCVQRIAAVGPDRHEPITKA